MGSEIERRQARRRREALADLVELEGYQAAAVIIREDVTGYATIPNLQPGNAAALREALREAAGNGQMIPRQAYAALEELEVLDGVEVVLVNRLGRRA